MIKHLEKRIQKVRTHVPELKKKRPAHNNLCHFNSEKGKSTLTC